MKTYLNTRSLSPMNFSPAFFHLKLFKAFEEKRENWRQVLLLRSRKAILAKQILAISSAVRGFHVYKDIWKPSIGDKRTCEREFDDCFDKFAIRVVNKGETAGHFIIPREFSKIAWYRFDFILVFWG